MSQGRTVYRFCTIFFEEKPLLRYEGEMRMICQAETVRGNSFQSHERIFCQEKKTFNIKVYGEGTLLIQRSSISNNTFYHKEIKRLFLNEVTQSVKHWAKKVF